MSNKKYTMNISLNVLNHLGINLYSNTPAVIAEVIANAWDAGATRVDINFDTENKTVTVSDDGCGMDENDINNRYLYIGYQRRDSQGTPRNRKPMGRKGIGKLSLFSIANKIHVQSRKDGKENALLMDAGEIKEAIKQDKPEEMRPYNPQPVDFKKDLLLHSTGTAIHITELKKRITEMSKRGLKKRLARRFSVIKGDDSFDIFLNGQEIKFSDRDYFHKARFLFQYGSENFSEYCTNLEKNENGDPYVFNQSYKFDDKGKINDEGRYEVKGWIAVARHSNDLDEKAGGEEEDNLNNIVIVVRGKVAQEDILHQFRIGGLITKYLYGEIQADFLDDDNEEDITTSSRQKIMEDTSRYQALKKFIEHSLLSIRTETDKLKKKTGVKKALEYHPKIKEWYNELNGSLKRSADTLFETINQIDVDDNHKATLYTNGILAFEKMKMDNSLSKLDNMEVNDLEALLKIFKDIDYIEAAHYYEIVTDRLKIIGKLQKITDEGQKEKVIQEYIFYHLWLLDPAWERATSDAEKENTIQRAITSQRDQESKKVKSMRIDIQYKKVSGAHVIIELKRASRRMKKTELEEQIKKYMDAVKCKFISSGNNNELLEGICIVGKMPVGWDNEKKRQDDIDSLKPYGIRILTYDELIDNAYSAYSKFIEKREEIGKLRDLIDAIRNIPNEVNGGSK